MSYLGYKITKGGIKMYTEEIMKLKVCIECRKEIQIGQKVVLIYKDRINEYWVHTEKCLADYSKFLTDPEGLERGDIIGICDCCDKPVRHKDKYDLLRLESRFGSDTFSEIIPSEDDALSFMHMECLDKAARGESVHSQS